MQKLAIIGGGITGLCAAFEAGKRKIDTILLEKNFNVGGRLDYAVSFTTQRFQPRVYRLLEELEIKEILVPVSPTEMGMYVQGRIMGFDQFPEMIKMLPPDQQNIVNAIIGEAMQSNFDPENPSPNLIELREKSFGQYLREKGCSIQTIKMIMEPMLTFTFAEEINLDQISADYGLFNIRFGMEMGAPDVFTFEEGIRMLADILSAKAKEIGVKIETEAKVTRIEKLNGKFKIHFEKLGEKKEIEAEKVILAVPICEAKEILPELKFPEGVSYLPTKCLLLKGKLKGKRKYILGIPGNEENIRFIFEGPYGIFYAYPYFMEKPMNLDFFFETYSVKSEITISCSLSIISPRAEIPLVKTNIENLFFAGDYYYYPYIEGCIFTAQKAIEAAAK